MEWPKNWKRFLSFLKIWDIHKVHITGRHKDIYIQAIKCGYQNNYTCVGGNTNKPLPNHIPLPTGSLDIFTPSCVMWFPIESSLDCSGLIRNSENLT